MSVHTDPPWYCNMVFPNTHTIGSVVPITTTVSSNTWMWNTDSQAVKDMMRYITEAQKLTRADATTDKARTTQVKGWPMFVTQLKDAKMDTASLEELLLLDFLADGLLAKLYAWNLDAPEWLKRQQREIAREIPKKLEQEMDKLQDEAHALLEKQQKREALEARATKIREALEKQRG